MSMHYGVSLHHYTDLSVAEAEADARDKHARYYTDAVGWLYRCVANSYATADEWGDWRSTGPRLELFAFPVVRWTPKGAWIKDIHGRRPLNVLVGLSNPHHKQYASRTALEAVDQLRERRRRQVWVLGRQLARAQEEMAMCEKVANRGCNPLLVL